jgi:NAD(P)-dependent dehydrogenase (short-subunit alcohol dehydrogenase family)
MSRSLPGTCECSRLDLADFSSVRSFAAATRHSLQQHKQRLALLCNNAGARPIDPAPNL